MRFARQPLARVGAGLLGLVTAVALFGGGRAAFGLLGPGVQSVTQLIVAGIRAVALPTPVLREHAAARAAPDRALEEGQLQELRVALAEAWRAGAEDAGAEADLSAPVATEPTASADPPAAPTVGIAEATPPAAIADAIAPPSTANTSPAPSATGSADAPAATPSAALR